jgi:ATPase family protein associated with various cellular activities (AAA)/winged helix domain-containing protein
VNAVEKLLDWTDANQRMLAAEFARIKCRLAGEADDEPRSRVERYRATLESPSAIDQLAASFDLSEFERDLLLLCAGVEMDSTLAGMCFRGGGAESQRFWATFGLALSVLPEPHWSALTPLGPLRRWRLLEIDENSTFITARLRIDERVLHYLAGINSLDVRLRPLLRPLTEQPLMAASQVTLAQKIVDCLESSETASNLLQLSGNDPHGHMDVAAYVTTRAGLTLYAISATDLPAAAPELEAFVTLWEREVRLSACALLVEMHDTAAATGMSVRRLVERIGGTVILSLRAPMTVERSDLRYRVDKPAAGEQLQLWREALGSIGAPTLGLADAVAGFRLSAREVSRVTNHVRARSAGSAEVLQQQCRELEFQRLDGLAQRIESTVSWSELVLPSAQMAALRQIASHVRHRATVHERWGFAEKGFRGLGLAVLFAGDSGTGKTMAAEVLAYELGLALLRVDLASVVSKYIGETEKNLSRIFDAAEDGGAILLFDEADALFGRRSEVKDSHDRYANIEVSYLLQRMEAYRGLAILTSNQKAALDSAFHRRLRLVVNFPFPDAAERSEIWRRVFPEATPTAGLDAEKLGRLQMSGGQIRNIAINAAFYAAEANEPVAMGHLLRAAHAEAAKRDRSIADAELRGWQ